MNLELLARDWRKSAAAQTADKGEVEKAFLDQAYQFIQNKATPLMREPYRVGFEVVHRNDDNTRMVGIFVFRVGKELFYAPVFFLNGSVKGTDLFYRHTDKKFVPLTTAWVEYLVNRNSQPEGTGVPISDRVRARDQMNLNKIIYPPMVTKFASITIDVQPEEVYAEMQLAAGALPDASILRRFIEEDGGQNAINKIAYTCQHDEDFANALVVSSKIENYCPILTPRIKVASEPEALLVVHTGILRNKNVSSAAIDSHKMEKAAHTALGAMLGIGAGGVAGAALTHHLSPTTLHTLESFLKDYFGPSNVELAGGAAGAGFGGITGAMAGHDMQPDPSFTDRLKGLLGKSASDLGLTKEAHTALGAMLGLGAGGLAGAALTHKISPELFRVLEKVIAPRWAHVGRGNIESLALAAPTIAGAGAGGLAGGIAGHEMSPEQADPTFMDKLKGLVHKQAAEAVIAKALKDNYLIEDHRKDANINPVISDNSEELQAIMEPGIYDVVLANGDKHSMLVAHDDPRGHVILDRKPSNPDRINSSGSVMGSFHDPHETRELRVVDLTNHTQDRVCGERAKLYGTFRQSIEESGEGSEKPEAGKAYVLYSKLSQALSAPFYVVSTGTDGNGMSTASICGHRTNPDGDDVVLTLNPDFEGYDPYEKVIGKACVFIPIDFKKDDDGYIEYQNEIPFGNRHTLTRMIFESGYILGKVHKVPQESGYVVQLDEKTRTREMSKLAAVATLMTFCSLREDGAEELLGMAEKSASGSHGFWYRPVEAIKQASEQDLFEEFKKIAAQHGDAFVALVKQAGHIDPTVAQWLGMLPFGSTIYGSMAGGSPRAGINLATRDSAESLGGMGIGAGAGAAVGAGLGALTRNPEAIRGGAGIGAVLGGIPGGILGGMHGSAASADNWNAEHGTLIDKLRGLLSKSAYNLRIPRFPEFEETINSDFHTLEQPYTKRIVFADRDIPDHLEHRIGDKWSVESNENLDTASPMQLYNLSQERGVDNLFEHGVVGSLTQTYDSMQLVDKYLPDLENALDRLGRMLFLFYWKPEDFAQAYGTDDQEKLENKLTSNFKSFGDLVLELLQKSKKIQEGTPSLT